MRLAISALLLLVAAHAGAAEKTVLFEHVTSRY